jgi:citronellyl-CoA dehydrogenase
MYFTEEHQEFRKTLAAFVRNEIRPYVDEWERAGTFPAHELFKKLGNIGALGLEYDPRYGGGGGDHLYTVILGEELGRSHCTGVPMAIGVQTSMATPALHQFGSDELKLRYLAPAISGEAVCAIAVTEPDAGSDVSGIRTRARRDGDDWVIDGRKAYITNGTQADWICLLARTSDEGGHRGMSQIIVETATPGFSVSRKLDKLGNRSSDTAELAFDSVRVPVSNTIGEIGRGFQQQMVQFQDERMIGSYYMLGSMEEAIARTVAYLKERQAFGAPLIKNQYIVYRIAELIAEIHMLKQYNYACAEAYMRGEDTSMFASVAKLKAGRLSRQVADTCIQFHGGIGYMEETWTSRYFRDARLTSIGGGADEIMLRVIADAEGLLRP